MLIDLAKVIADKRSECKSFGLFLIVSTLTQKIYFGKKFPFFTTMIKCVKMVIEKEKQVSVKPCFKRK